MRKNYWYPTVSTCHHLPTGLGESLDTCQNNWWKKINNSKANDEQSTSSYLTKVDPVHIHQYGESSILSKDIDLTKITKVLSVHRTKITKVLSNQPVGKGRPAQLERMSDLRSRSPGLRGTKTGACCGRKCAGSSLFKPNSIYHNNIIIYIYVYGLAVCMLMYLYGLCLYVNAKECKYIIR